MTQSPNAPVNASTTSPPRFVNIAYWLFLLVALLHLVGLIISAATFGTTSDAAKSQISKSGSGVSSSQVNTILGASLVTAIVFGALFIIAFVIFDVFMRRGANWARVVLLIITVLSLTGVTGGYGVGAAGVVAAVIATVLMFLRPSSEYFRDTKARKLGQTAA